MGQDSFTPQKRATGGGGLPTTNGRGGRALGGMPRGRQIHKTFNNIKITILCGFVTILVLRGTIGVGNLGSSDADVVNQNLIEETNRFLAEIRSDDDPTDPEDPSQSNFNPNVTYTLGPKISNWDQERKAWLEQNSEFPNFINGKAKILLLSGSPPKPCDNAIGDHYLLKSIKNKIDYCRIHGIEIVYNMAHLDMELAGYWAKLPMIRRLMLSHPEVEWIWWMDSDALFTDMVFEIPLNKYENSNMVIHGYPDLFDQRSWIALNTGSFLFRNCQWSLDLLDAWAPMGPKGPIREEAGKILTANLKGRPAFEADDQSALIYLLLTQKQWMEKVFLENQYYLHGYWAGLVDRYEEMLEKYHPGLGDERWPFVTHFVGCKPCGRYADYSAERCLKSMERAFNFADNQVLKLYGFGHRGLLSPKIKRIRNETVTPLQYVDQFDIRHQELGKNGSLS
ncbi:putative glycosyltransferase 5 [Tripterygium wilfordii]|uniref:xyloglucan 6-xylosyltransferase n=1 Tax=Tripterygium wilfordii TaxID=458696 RepID=A0A7J7CJF1_TRIWF|nr:probable xyloglucan 6-xylosyltransferase 5 [Tripterygium wilfordii]XP_038679867.1 probable xyloglucan 6-xylosyltransferase 5 [Tripterygium wilfordii]KAF5734131.1 putative glycosyltransferase 5 [Tripterygium wilfordii]